MESLSPAVIGALALFLAPTAVADQNDPTEPRPVFNSHPAWSPDGKRIAFDSNREDTDREVYVLDLETQEIERLTDNSADDRHPYWSPDGRFLAFESDRDGDFEIIVYALETGRETQVTNNDHFDALPTWHPNGERLVFTSRPSGRGEIHEVNLEQGTVRVLHAGPDNASEPIYSPDGNTLAYRSDRAGPNHIFVRAHKGLEKNITQDLPQASEPWWASQTDLLFFGGGADSNRYFRLDTTTGKRTLVVATQGYGIPSTSPDGSRIVFMEPAGMGHEIVTYDSATGRTRRWTHSNEPANR